MGLDTLPTRGNTTMLAEWFNVLRSALANDLVPRNVNGIVTERAGSVGTVDFPWLNGRFDNLFVGGDLVEPGKVTARTHRIASGKANADGYPNFLTPAGAGNGLSAVLSATSTNFSAFINGTEAVVGSDMTYSSLTAAPGSNNTCAINDALLNDLPDSNTLGEHDSRAITIDAVGSGITALNGCVAAFKTGAEVFLAKVDTTNNCLRPIFRGWAGTSRVTLYDDDTITLLKMNTLLLKDDGATKLASTYYPESVTTIPASATAGKIFFERSTGKHYYDDGATVSAAYLVVGYAVCSSADCLYVQHNDFDMFWDDAIKVDYYTHDTTSVMVRAHSRVSICGQSVEWFEDQHMTQATHMDAGETIAVDSVWYLYATPTGELVFSSIAPRPMDALKRGFYHPLKYYRCVGAVMTGGASDFRNEDTAEFTADGNWSCPVGVAEIVIEAVGGGGGGGSGAANVTSSPYVGLGGQGGGGSGNQETRLKTTPGKIYAVHIGLGGAGGSSGYGGSRGGVTTFGSDYGASPGYGGFWGLTCDINTDLGIARYAEGMWVKPTNGTCGGGNGGSSTSSDEAQGCLLHNGGNPGAQNGVRLFGGGGGGGGGRGSGANGGNYQQAGSNAAANTGAGGGGAGADSSTGKTGGNGGSGWLRVSYDKPRFDRPLEY